jgi:shikimate dehydrogenase
VSEPQPGAVRDGAQRFLDAELEGLAARDGAPSLSELVAGQVLDEPARQPANVAAIGTTAAKAVRGELLARAIAERGFELATATALATPEELFGDPVWRLGVVLSPWKQEIGERCDVLAASALATGVVDTVLRTVIGAVGFNTNTWAAMSALEVLTGNANPGRLLLLGAGASARSVALAVTRAWPGCEIVVAARSRHSAEKLVKQIGGRLLDDLARGEAHQEPWEVVVNTTTWGETEASETEPLGIDIEGMFVPGGRFFDLNNRISALQHRALADGCAVVSGGVMQRVTNASRAALLLYAEQV